MPRARPCIFADAAPARSKPAAAIAADGSGNVHWHICDIRDAAQVDAMVDAIWAVGPLTGLVNNAAANFIAPTKQLSARGLRAITSTVMAGSFHVMRAIGTRWIGARIGGSVAQMGRGLV